MAKLHSKYVCQQCGYETTGWLGKCPECGTWGSLVETLVSNEKTKELKNGKTSGTKPVSLSSIKISSTNRTSTKISELDRVLGGGIVPGQVVLLAGEPGVGKSTILLQLSENLGKVVYVSGEESAHQIKLRADRLKIKNKNIHILEETDIDGVIAQVASLNSRDLVIIDSIQTMATSDLRGMSGSSGQVRECAYRLVRLAKTTGIPIFIVGHVTKEGAVAGPALLMHIVDTVLWFEGSRDLSFRLIRARKNRFGPTDEVGIFTMETSGLTSVTDTTNLFLSEEGTSIPGSCVTSIMEGTRPILVEIQSLLVPTKMAFPRRIAQGIDAGRLELLLAVLQRRCGLNVGDFDSYINVVGGIKIKDTGVDLALSLSIASSYFNKALPKKFMALGEVGLSGEVRSAATEAKRVSEAKRLGYKSIVTSRQAPFLRDAIRMYFK